MFTRPFVVHTVILGAVTMAGCFAPSFRPELACGPGGECPPGMSCGGDNQCRIGSAAVDGAVDVVPMVDAEPDAPPVACVADLDCATPPDLCQTNGVCDLTTNTCDFTHVDCSALTNECNVGVCEKATGACLAEPTNIDAVCGVGDVCGNYSVCGSFSDTCDSSGSQSRSCTRNACNAAGVCVATPRTETAGCARATNGTDCATDTITGCGGCGGFSDTCDEGGTASCTCTDFKCQADVCQPIATTCAQSCARETDGALCASMTVTDCSACDYSSICDEDASQTCTCSTFSCVNGTCSSSSTSCAQSCSRSTDGEECDCRPCGSTGRSSPRACTNGACGTAPSGACGAC